MFPQASDLENCGTAGAAAQLKGRIVASGQRPATSEEDLSVGGTPPHESV